MSICKLTVFISLLACMFAYVREDLYAYTVYSHMHDIAVLNSSIIIRCVKDLIKSINN